MYCYLLKCAAWAFTLTAIAVASTENKVSVEEIVQRHLQALGGREKLDSVQSTITHAEYREGTLVIPDAFVAKMRPYYRTICDPRQKLGEVCEGYDGSAWEWYADPGVVLRVVGAAAAATRHGTEFIDSLVDYKSRGTKVDLGWHRALRREAGVQIAPHLGRWFREGPLRR
jgi:hypothetical protein